MGGAVKEVKSKGELDREIKEGSAVILHFWASWCDASKHMDNVLSHLSTDFPQAHFLRVEAEEQPEISEAYSISAVPYFVFFKDGKTVDTLEGADPSSLANKVAKVAGSNHPGEPAAPASLGMAAAPTIIETVRELSNVNDSSPLKGTKKGPNLEDCLKKLITSSPVMLFMKGNADYPKCGFSSKVVEALKEEGVEFGSFDILSDEEVRQGLKKFSNWPTFPQLYYKGELIGGCDIVLEMKSNGELKSTLTE